MRFGTYIRLALVCVGVASAIPLDAREDGIYQVVPREVDIARELMNTRDLDARAPNDGLRFFIFQNYDDPNTNRTSGFYQITRNGVQKINYDPTVAFRLAVMPFSSGNIYYPVGNFRFFRGSPFSIFNNLFRGFFGTVV